MDAIASLSRWAPVLIETPNLPDRLGFIELFPAKSNPSRRPSALAFEAIPDLRLQSSRRQRRKAAPPPQPQLLEHWPSPRQKTRPGPVKPNAMPSPQGWHSARRVQPRRAYIDTLGPYTSIANARIHT